MSILRTLAELAPTVEPTTAPTTAPTTGGMLLFGVGLCMVALLIAWFAAVFRPRSIEGPQRLALGIPAATAHDVGELLAAGQPDAVRLTQEAGRRIGEVLSTVVSVLNPGVVVLGGELDSPPLLSGVRESLYRLSLPRATRHLALHQGALGGDAPIVGLARLVVDQQFAAAAVDARLR